MCVCVCVCVCVSLLGWDPVSLRPCPTTVTVLQVETDALGWKPLFLRECHLVTEL